MNQQNLELKQGQTCPACTQGIIVEKIVSHDPINGNVSGLACSECTFTVS